MIERFAHNIPMVWCPRQHTLVPLDEVERINPDGTFEHMNLEPDDINIPPTFLTDLEFATLYAQMARDDMLNTAAAFPPHQLNERTDAQRNAIAWLARYQGERYDRLIAALHNLGGNI